VHTQNASPKLSQYIWLKELRIALNSHLNFTNFLSRPPNCCLQQCPLTHSKSGQSINFHYLYINRGRYVHAILCPRPRVAAFRGEAACPRVAAKPRVAKPRVRVSRRSRLATCRGKAARGGEAACVRVSRRSRLATRPAGGHS